MQVLGSGFWVGEGSVVRQAPRVLARMVVVVGGFCGAGLRDSTGGIILACVTSCPSTSRIHLASKQPAASSQQPAGSRNPVRPSHLGTWEPGERQLGARELGTGAREGAGEG